MKILLRVSPVFDDSELSMVLNADALKESYIYLLNAILTRSKNTLIVKSNSNANAMQILNCEQNSPEWFKARLGVPTASNFKSVLAKGAGRSRQTYLEKLATEIVTGELAEGFTTVHLDRGKDMEEEARQAYRGVTDNEIYSVGFVLNGRIGWSPDSLVHPDGALEIKTQREDLIKKTLEKGVFPPEHYAQCQGGLFVGEREWIDICVYWPGMPLFIKRAYRDEKYIKNLSKELEIFLDDLDNLVAKMDREMVQYEYPPVDDGPF